MAKSKKWIGKATANKGGLHRSLGVPEGQKIPAAKLAQAANSKNPRVRKQAALAKTLGKMNKGGEAKPRAEKWYGKQEG